MINWKSLIGPILLIIGLFLFLYSNIMMLGHEQILNSSNLSMEEVWQYQGALSWWRNSYINFFLPSAVILTSLGAIILIRPLVLKRIQHKIEIT